MYPSLVAEEAKLAPTDYFSTTFVLADHEARVDEVDDVAPEEFA